MYLPSTEIPRCRQTSYLKIWFINGVDNVNWPPYRDWKADVSSVSPSSEQMLWQRANGRNVSFSISVRWSIYIINSVDKPNFRVSLPHRRSTTVSSETNPQTSYLLGMSRTMGGLNHLLGLNHSEVLRVARFYAWGSRVDRSRGMESRIEFIYIFIYQGWCPAVA